MKKKIYGLPTIERVHVSTKIVDGISLYELSDEMIHINKVKVNRKVIKHRIVSSHDGHRYVDIDNTDGKYHSGIIEVFYDKR